MARVIDEFTDIEEDVFEDQPIKPTTRTGLQSVYDQFRAELSKPVDSAPTFVYKTKSRPIGVRFSTDLPLEKLERWRKVAAKRSKNDADVLQLAYLVIAGQAQCFVMNGEDVTDNNGEAPVFRSKDVQESLGVLDYQGAIHKFYGSSDPEVLRASGEILEKCGWGDDEDFDEEDDEDPLD